MHPHTLLDIAAAGKAAQLFKNLNLPETSAEMILMQFLWKLHLLDWSPWQQLIPVYFLLLFSIRKRNPFIVFIVAVLPQGDTLVEHTTGLHSN